MGLTVAIGSALSGLKASQTALEVISRNISNAGTPGYHKQSLNVIEVGRGDNSYVRAGSVQRAFDSILQGYYTKQVPNSAYTASQASFLDRLQTVLGKPGSAGSLDTMLGNLQNALSALATSPDNYATRADMVSQATNMAGTLNRMSDEIQGMRRETETRIATAVDHVNSRLTSLRDINLGLADYGLDQTTRASLLDQRDRLVSDLSEMMDLRVDYNPDGTVRLGTLSGTTILDVKAARFEFDQAGSLTPRSEFSLDDAQSGVGKLELVMPNGTRIDLVKEGAIRSGTLGALVEMRDGTLQNAQRQLDDIAAGLAQIFSTDQRPGTTIANGMELNAGDLAALQPGNDVVVGYTDANGVARELRIVNVANAGATPRSYTDSNGAKTVEVRASGEIANLLADLTSAGIVPPNFPTFGQDADGNLNVTSTNMAVTKLVARPTVPTGVGAEVERPGLVSADLLTAELSAGALASAKFGDSVTIDFHTSLTPGQIRLVNVANPSSPPQTYTDGTTRVYEVRLSQGATNLAQDLNEAKNALGSNWPPTLDIGVDSSGDLALNASGPITIDAVAAKTTNPTSLALNLFVDSGDKPFTNALEGQGQRLGFASRIKVAGDVVANNKLLVDYTGGGTASGDSKRVEFIVDQFKSMRFGSNTPVGNSASGFRLSGTISDMVSQTMEYQGSNIATGLAANQTNEQTLAAITSRMEETYGVDINEEVARLMELQNAYAANARVASVVQELLNTLMQAFS